MPRATETSVEPLGASLHRSRLLVLGGTGFVGSAVCDLALERGFNVVSLSRHKGPSPRGDNNSRFKWICGDATTPGFVEEICCRHGPFDGVIHCIGVLFDSLSGFRLANWIVSGNRSIAASGPLGSYDAITRMTGLALVKGAEDHCVAGTPCVFVSAAEAGWPHVPGGQWVERWLAPPFLKRYLRAKRAVEAQVLGSSKLRGIVMRPSFVVNWKKIDVWFPALLWFLLATIGVPFLEKPVSRQVLASAIVESIADGHTNGVQRVGGMLALARTATKRSARDRQS